MIVGNLRSLRSTKFTLDNNPQVGVSYSGSRFIDEQGNLLRQSQQRPKLENITAKDILTRNPVGNGSAPLIRRSALEAIAFNHPEELSDGYVSSTKHSVNQKT